MKTLQQEFVANYGQVGNNTFRQIKREGDVAVYQRINRDGTTRGYDVFVVRVVAAGAKLPNGTTVAQSYEQYPGASAFGRTAYDCRSIDSAMMRFEELKQKLAAKNSNTSVTSPVDNGVKRRGRPARVKHVVNIPEGRFTMRMLMNHTGLSQPVLHPIVTQWVANSKVTVVDRIKAEGGRGRPSMVYQAL